MPSKYAATSNVGCDENVHYDMTMCIITSEGLSSLIALLLLQVREDLPSARPNEERQEEDARQEAHAKPDLRRSHQSNYLLVLFWQLCVISFRVYTCFSSHFIFIRFEVDHSSLICKATFFCLLFAFSLNP